MDNETNLTESLPSTTGGQYTSDIAPSVSTLSATALITTMSATGNLAGPLGNSESLKAWVYGLAVSTALFFITTIFLFIVLIAVICCRRLRQAEIEKTKDVVFEAGCSKTSHWIDTAVQMEEGDSHCAELPIWSVQTFTTPGSPLSTPNQSNSNTATSDTIRPVDVPQVPPTSKSKPNVIPKRVAPPPPKGKKRKKSSSSKVVVSQEAAEYAVPIVTHHWYSWNKKKNQQKSAYKELDLSRVDNPNVYAKPAVPV